MMLKIPLFTYKIALLAVFSLLFACTEESTNKINVDGIDANVELIRFDEAFYTSPPSKLARLKKEFRPLFPTATPDSIWTKRMTDPEEQELFKESQKALGDFSSETQALTSLFKHIKYYFPKFSEPKVVTLMTLDAETAITYRDSLLFVSVDHYLGRNHKLYEGFPAYVSHNFDKSHLPVDVAEEIINNIVPFKIHRTFLDKIIVEGKRLYLVDLFLPNLSDAEKFGISEEKMNWTKANEEGVWRYFIQNKLLYSTDNNLDQRFIKDAPFSKFYLDHDSQSPGRIGAYMGWQIVRAYMARTNATITDLLRADGKKIFKDSRYKPKQ